MPRQFVRRAVFAVVATLVVSCKSTTPAPIDDPVETVEVTPTTVTLEIGENQTLVATPKAAGNALTGRTITWLSSNTAVATVNANGAVHAVKGGTTQITATSESKVGSATATVNHPVPTTTTIAPAAATAGGAAFSLTVTGSNFVTGAEVRWNGTPRPTTFVSATQLTAAIPANDITTVGTASVTVVNPTPGGGTSPSRTFTISPVTVPVDNPLPVLASISPSTSVVGNAAFTLTVNGSGFVAGSLVRWNGTPRTTTFVSAVKLTAAITATDIASVGTAQVTVFSPAPGGGTSTQSPFTITASLAPAVALGENHGCAIKPNASAWCWGSNASGKLGNNGAATSAPKDAYVSTPTPVLGGLQFKRIAAGGEHTCGITTSGSAYCWGAGLTGALGAGAIFLSTVPIAVSGGLTFNEISIGDGSDVTCALTTAGLAYCWGLGSNGALGNGGTSNSNVPVPVSGGRVFASIASDADHSCALDGTGAAWCWGTGGNGQLGVVTPSSAVPVAVSGGHLFTHISVGAVKSCGVTSGGQVYCWGLFEDPTPATPKLKGYAQNFRSVQPRSGLICGITTADVGYCSGTNYYGEVGNGTRTNAGASMSPISGGLLFKSIAINGTHTSCGFTTSNLLYCWGTSADFGMLGNGTLNWTPAPVQVTSGVTYKALSTAAGESCGVSLANVLYCWGRVGDDLDPATPLFAAPTILSGTTSLVSLSGGAQHFCGLSAAGAAQCWGGGSNGQLGNGGSSTSNTPVNVTGGLTFAAISAASRNTCGVTLGNALYCWGSNSLQPASTSPITFGSGSFNKLTGNSFHRCVLSTTGVASCWGGNSNGQLGDGTLTTRTTPTPVSTALTFASIAAGAFHTCAITVANAAYCWGNGVALGNGANTQRTTPIAVSGGHLFKQIVLGYSHTCALTTTNATYCWGTGGYGALGDNDAVAAANTPQLVNVSGLVSLTAYDKHTCGLTAAGVAWCWGSNAFGQIGNGLFGFSTVPVPVTW